MTRSSRQKDEGPVVQNSQADAIGAENKRPPMVSFEIKPARGEKSETVIAAALRVFRRAWAKA